MIARIVWCALLLACANAAKAAPVFPRAVESRSELELRKGEAILHIAFPGRPVPWKGTIEAEWLDPLDTVLARGSAPAAVNADGAAIAISMPSPFSTMSEEAQHKAVWHRIRYTLRAADGTASSPGILSISGMRSRLFVLQVLGPTTASLANPTQVIVRAVHPATEAPVEGVSVSLHEGIPGPAAMTGVTDSSGQASFQITLPSNTPNEELSLEIQAQVADYTVAATHRLEIDRNCRQEIRTDKKLYQPGQTIHIRTVVFGPSGKALANTQVRISLQNPRGAKLFESTVTATKLGVAAADLVLPERAETGEYRIESEIADGEFEGDSSGESFTVANYDLPTFAVSARTARPWYLAGQEIRITVSAQFIFGKPLPRGHVTVTERGDPVASGELDGGAAEIAIPNPRQSRTWARSFSVSVQAPDGRAEKQDLTVPVADQAIALTFSGEGRLSHRWPTPLYVTARYPDGAPAMCAGAIVLRGGAAALRTLPIRTNRFGVAVVDAATLPGVSDSYQLTARVSDTRGNTGAAKSELHPRKIGIRVETDRLIYRQGDPIEVRMRSEKESDQFYLAIADDNQVIDFKLVRTQNHSAATHFSYSDKFAGVIHVLAQGVGIDFDSQLADGLAVYYDVRERLNLMLQPSRAEYKPGERASLRMRLTNEHGDPVQGAIGLSVIDKAVEELGRSRETSYVWRGRGDLQIDAGTSDPEALADAAAKLADEENYPVLFPSVFFPKPPEIYHQRIEKDTEAVRAALTGWHGDGNPYPKDSAALTRALAREGVNLTALLDPWRTPYRAEIRGDTEYTQLQVVSAGPDGKFGTADDIRDIQLSWRWFDEYVARIQIALRNAPAFPSTGTEFRRLVAQAGLGRALTAPDGRPLIVQAGHKTVNFRDTNLFDYTDYVAHPLARGAVTVTTRRVPVISVFELAGDHARLNLASFTAPAEPRLPKLSKIADQDQIAPMRSGVDGVVVDPFDAPIPNVGIEASNAASGQIYRTNSAESGAFVLFLPEGTWTIRTSSLGFNAFVVTGVPVISGQLTSLNVRLQVGSVSETVEVSADVATINTASASVMSPMRKMAAPPPPPPDARKYFPETLFWAPLIETDRDGWASASFDLADSITTWKLNAIGSSADGGVSDESAEIRAFQPFFLEYNPPKLMTQGDEIELTAALRNYESTAQSANIGAKLQGLEATGPMESTLSAVPGESANVVLRVRAESAGKATVRIDAVGNSSRDAIEKSFDVRPDGRRVAASASDSVSDASVSKLSISASALPGTIRSRLLFYPSLAAHIFDARRSILQRPWGCGEQTISSTFPDLLVLEFLQRSKIADAATQATALGYVEAGYRRLLGFQFAGQGFSYFGERPDAALTAYAIEFLDAASAYTTVDPDVIKNAANWLWTAQKNNADSRTTTEAAYAVAVLANHSTDHLDQLNSLVAWLETHGALNDPHSAASMIRIYAAQGNTSGLRQAVQRLLSEMRRYYWSSEATPFWERGHTGDIETTSLALRALEVARQAGVPDLDADIQGAVLWLLRNKDEFGAWGAGHASVRALQALAPLAEPPGAGAGRFSLSVNGHSIASQFTNEAMPVEIDLTQWVKPGENTVRFSGAFQHSAAAILSAYYYEPWTNVAVPSNATAKLSVSFDRDHASVGDVVECVAVITPPKDIRIGMLVAEIGLPPGAEVDRASLDRAIWKNGLWRYEMEPDRVILYFWSGSASESARFTFRPRFAMRAKSSPSELWEYYNPDERTVVAPVEFVIRP